MIGDFAPDLMAEDKGELGDACAEGDGQEVVKYRGAIPVGINSNGRS